MVNFERNIDPKSSMGIGRGTYSKKEFDGYKYRASVRIEYKSNGSLHDTLIDVYTDVKDRYEAQEEISSRGKEKVTFIEIINWTSKLQDVLNAAFIDEVLKDL